MMAETKIKAWHFLPSDYRLRYGDRRIVAAGDVVRVNCEPVLCQSGLHASERILVALEYAPGPILCRVLVGGTIVRGNDKLVGTTREVLWTLDATHVLHRFTCWCAEKTLRRADVTDERCWNAIHTKLRWLDGLATDEELDKARAASREASRAASWEASRAASRAASWAASRAASWAASREASWESHSKRLAAMVNAIGYESEADNG